MKYLLSLLLCFGTAPVIGQIYIKYDLNTRTVDKPIPFDKPFTLEVTPVKSKTIAKALVFWVDYQDGLIILKDPNNPIPGGIRASFELKKQPKSDDTKVIFAFPALKPEKDFRIHLQLHYSSNSNLMLYSLLNDMYKVEKSHGNVSTDTTLDNTLQEFISAAEVHFPGDKLPMSPFQDSLQHFVNTIYRPAVNELKLLLDSTNQKIASSFLTADELTEIANHLEPKSFLSANIHYAQRILDDHTISSLMLGLLPFNYKHKDSITYYYNFEARAKNMAATKGYIDSLRTACTILKAKLPPKFTSILTNTETIYWELEVNERNFNRLVAQMRSRFPKKLVEISNLLDASTLSADLQTTSKRHFTIEAGLANLWVYDNLNEQKQLLKPFFGVTYHFRSLDKLSNLKRIPAPPAPDEDYSHELESRYNFWQRVSVTLGLTIGSMSNKDFDNLYNTFSFLLGPSYRLTEGVRISGGVSAVKRMTYNPLLSDKKTIYGTYASVSLDYDLLDAIKSVTSMIFK